MRSHTTTIQSEDEYQQIASLTKEKIQAFNASDLDSVAKINAAIEIREYCQWLIEYDKQISRPPQHEDYLDKVNEFLGKESQPESEDELNDWELINHEEAPSFSHLEKLPLEILLKIFSYLSIEETGKASAASRTMHRMVEPGNVKAQGFWKERLEQHFPNYFSRVSKGKVDNWYVELVKVYSSSYTQKKTRLFGFLKDEEIKLPSRIRKMISMVKEGDLQGLKKLGVTYDDLLVESKNGSNIVGIADYFGKQEILDYFYHDLIVPAVKKSGDTSSFPLWAVRCNKVEILREMGASDQKAFYVASILKKFDMADILLLNGAVIDFRNEYKLRGRDGAKMVAATTLFAAADRGDLDMVKFLVERGANLEIASEGGSYAYEWSPIYAAVVSGHEEIVKYLLDHGANPNHGRNTGRTPLHAAAEKGHLRVVQYLVDHGADIDLNGTFSIGKHYWFNLSPITYALLESNHEIVKYLISKGANVNILNKSTNMAACPLIFALRYNSSTQCIKELLSSENIIVIEEDLKLAIQKKRPEVAREIEIILLEKYIKERGAPDAPEYKRSYEFLGKKYNFGKSKTMSVRGAEAKLKQLKGEGGELSAEEKKALESGSLKKMTQKSRKS